MNDAHARNIKSFFLQRVIHQLSRNVVAKNADIRSRFCARFAAEHRNIYGISTWIHFPLMQINIHRIIAYADDFHAGSFFLYSISILPCPCIF